MNYSLKQSKNNLNKTIAKEKKSVHKTGFIQVLEFQDQKIFLHQYFLIENISLHKVKFHAFELDLIF